METKEIDAGTHILLDINDVDANLLGDKDFIESVMVEAAKKTGAKVLHSYFHHFGEQFGVTGVVAVSESHLSCHSWTEWNFISIDIYLCYGMDPTIASNHLIEVFNSKDYDIKIIKRKARLGIPALNFNDGYS